jgi:phage terminase large subunit
MSRVIIEILFGGGGRSGKTWGICEIINMSCIQYPGIVWLIGRNEWEDLRKSTLVTLTKVLRSHGMKKDIHYTLNLQTKELNYPNGSRIFFIPLKQQPSDPEFDFLGGYE